MRMSAAEEYVLCYGREGKILNTAFAVSGAFVFGDHLAFTAEVNPDMVIPLGGISAVTLSLFLLRPF